MANTYDENEYKHLDIKEEDFAILDKLNLPVKPVVMGFLTEEPEGLEKEEYPLSLCEMPKRAREIGPFYSGHNGCPGATYFLGYDIPEDVLLCHLSGEWGYRLGFTPWKGTIRRIYQNSPRLLPHSVKYIGFSTIDKLYFQPDILFIIADPMQTQTILRASSLYDGHTWVSKCAAPVECAWLFVYPLLTGEINYAATNAVYGRDLHSTTEWKAKGDQMISIPYDKIRTVLRNLKDLLELRPKMQPEGMPERRRKLTLEYGFKHRMAGTPWPSDKPVDSIYDSWY